MAQFLGSSATLQIRHSSLVAATAVAAVAGISTWHSSCQTSTEDLRVEVHLMDKIQQKDYLSDARDAIPSTLRILAIDLPEMRTHAFAGDCRLAHDKIFVDDVAIPKVVDVDRDRVIDGDRDRIEESKSRHKKGITKLKVSQKALVKVRVQKTWVSERNQHSK